MGRRRQRLQNRGFFALAALTLLSGCAAALLVPLAVGSTLSVRSHAKVRAATKVPKPAKRAHKAAKATPAAATAQPTPAPTANPDDPWQKFITYALGKNEPVAPSESLGRSALLKEDPELDEVQRRDCVAPVPAVIIDLDEGATPFDPARLTAAPVGLAEGLAKLRQAGVVVLWISQLPAARAADVAQALRTSGLDPQGFDQLLLIRRDKDRKQMLRGNANDDVCIVAVAGDRRSDFDELFDYLRDPNSAFALDKMLGEGWFLVPSLYPAVPAAQPSTER
jgi:hypothetical protein